MLTIRLDKKGELQVLIPSARGTLPPRVLDVPLTLYGLACLKQILRDRAEAPAPPRIAEPGSPTQLQLRAMLAKFSPKPQVSRADPLGLDLEIDI